MHKTPLYVHIQNQYSKKKFIFFYITSFELLVSITEKKKMEGRESGKKIPHP